MLTPNNSNCDRQHQLAKLKKRQQELRNEMEFVEILAQFWPWPNMANKVERLQAEIKRLDHQNNRSSYLKVG